MSLISPKCVPPDNFGEILQNVVDPLVNDVGWLGLGDRAIEKDQELTQSRLVHNIDLEKGEKQKLALMMPEK